jgi:hypothetical protein
MAITNNLKKGIDLPTWEWLRFQPAVSTAGTVMCTSDDGSDRYIYYLNTTTFYRYDAWTDGWQTLAPAITAPSTAASLKYTVYGGYRGNCLGATSNTITIPGLKNNALLGYKIRILSGTGMGQERTISSITDATIQDSGIITAGGNTSLTDSTKKWAINQWVGYQVRIVMGTGLSQIRKVLYNDSTNIYWYDANYQQLEPWANTTLPTALSATAPNQAHYYIESSIATVDSNWTVQPDASSSFCVLSGGVWYLTSATTTPYGILFFYDVVSDTWTTKTGMFGVLPTSALTQAGSPEFPLERTGEVGGAYLTGTATAASNTDRSLTDSSKALTVGMYNNYQIRITGGTGIGQRRRIVTSTADMFYIEYPWDIVPDTTSTYSIFANVDNIYVMGGSNGSTIFNYSVEKDLWTYGHVIDCGTVTTFSAAYAGQEPFGLSSGTRNAGGIYTVNATPVAAGSGYVVGDLLTLTTGGSNGTVRVTGISGLGAITSVSLYRCGSGYSTGTSATSGGTGSSATISITAVGYTGYLTTVVNHNLCVGDSVVITGSNETNWNSTFTLIGCNSLTTFEIAIPSSTGSAGPSTNITSTTITDSTASWATNELAGCICMLQAPGTTPATVYQRRIASNAATYLTFTTTMASNPVSGTWRYAITRQWGLGSDTQYKTANQSNTGFATSGTTTTLVDSSKAWKAGQWLGYKLIVVSGTGWGTGEITINSNSTNSLVFSTQTFTPDATTRYIIADGFGTASATGTTTTLIDSSKNWITNQWAGQQVRMLSGTGAAQFSTIQSNTATTLTFTAVTTAPVADTQYMIQGVLPRGAGCSNQWAFGGTDATKAGKYLYSARGGGTTGFDRYDITTNLWDINLSALPLSETLNTGTMVAYDGVNRIYFTVNATGRVLYVDLTTLKIGSLSTTPFAQGTALTGNKMEIITTPDGLNYLYVMRHTGQEFFRTLIFL